jgi:hypothetical protein
MDNVGYEYRVEYGSIEDDDLLRCLLSDVQSYS